MRNRKNQILIRINDAEFSQYQNHRTRSGKLGNAFCMATTYLITAGIDTRTVAGKLDHANLTTTQLVYSHLLRQAEYETADVMDGILQDSLKYAEQKQCGHDGKHQN